MADHLMPPQVAMNCGTEWFIERRGIVLSKTYRWASVVATTPASLLFNGSVNLDNLAIPRKIDTDISRVACQHDSEFDALQIVASSVTLPWSWL